MDSKAFRPVWDKPVIEAPRRPLVPLPPAEVFIPTPPPVAMFAPRARSAPLVLPDFAQFAPAPSGFDAHMRDVAHRAAVMAELKSMGLIEET